MSTEPAASYQTADGFRGGRQLLVFQIVQYGLLFVSSLIITRALGPHGRAQYALAVNLALIAWALINLSTGPAVQRLFARGEVPLKELTRSLSTLTLLLGAVGFALTAAVGIPTRHALLGGASVPTVLLGAAFVPLTLLSQTPVSFLFRLGSLKPYGRIVVAAAAGQVALLVVCEVEGRLTPETVLLLGGASLLATAVASAVVLARIVGGKALVPSADVALLRRTLGIGARLHGASLAFYLNLRLDLLLVGALATRAQAGLYSLSVTLVEIFYVAITAVAIGALEAQTRAEAGVAARYTMDFIRQNLAVAVLLAGAAVAVAYPFIVLAYGSQWKDSVLPFAILAVAVTALAVENPARALLLRLAPPLAVSGASVAAVAVNVGLNLALIPALGIKGAAIASLVSYWCAAALMLALLARVSGVSPRRALSLPQSGDVVPATFTRLMRRRAND